MSMYADGFRFGIAQIKIGEMVLYLISHGTSILIIVVAAPNMILLGVA